jgi:hypothetical protein
MCNTLIEPICIVGHLIGSATSSAAGDVLSGIAQAVSNGLVWVVKNTATWWIQIPSVDLGSEPAVARLQQWLLPVTVAVTAGAVIAAGARMAIMRKANPLLDVTGGLLALAAATALGAVVPALLLKAGDAWSTWVLQVSTGGQFTQRLTTALTLGSSAAPAVVLIFGVIAIIFSIVQAVLMLFREAALIILAGVVPLAAAGSIAPMTRPWIRKVTSWMLALIFYKPAAAAVYATAFTLIGSGGSLQTVLMGFVMLLLSVLALPALMKFFTWTTGAVAGSGGGGQLLGAAAVGAFALGAMPSSRGGGSAAQDQAAYMSSRLGPSPGGSPGSSPGGSPGGPSGADSGAPGGPPSPGGWPPGPSGAAPGSPGSSARPAGSAAGSAASASPAPATTTAPTGAAESTASGAAGATSAGSSTAAAGAAAGAGPAGAAAATAAQAGSAAAHLATGAMEPEDQS